MPDRQSLSGRLQSRPVDKFNPLGRVLFHDDFDEGVNGWCELVGNHGGDLDRIRPAVADLRPPQLSTATFFDIGTHGALDGDYSLKLATRPKPGHQAVAIKRLTSQARGLVQFETWFTFKAEQQFGEDLADWDGNQDPSEANFGDMTFSNDICEPRGGPRYMLALRYRNADAEGNPVQKWLYKTSLHTTTKMAVAGREVEHSDMHVRDPRDWKEIPGGHQPLCFNEVATKINWHYLRWLYDTKARRNAELQVNDLTLNLRNIPVPFYEDSYSGLPNLLNFLVDVRTVRPVRNFLFLDSVLVSVDW